MTDRVPAEQVMREMIAATCPDAAPETIRELAQDVAETGLGLDVRPADLRRMAARFAGALGAVDFTVLTAALSVRVAGQTVSLTARKQRALLVGLLLREGQASVQQLIDDLWGDSPPANAAFTLGVYVHRIRRAMGDQYREYLSAGRGILERIDGGYALNMELVSSDLHRVRALEELARREQQAENYAEAHEALSRALGQFQGRPLAEEAGPFAKAQAGILEEWRLALVEQRLYLALKLGMYTEAAAEAEVLATAHPLHEEFHRLLMTALYRAGRPQAAATVFTKFRRRLVTELGMEPSRGLSRLNETFNDERRSSSAPSEPDPAQRWP